MPPSLPRATTVLVVEDNDLLLEMIARICAQHGLRALTASSGEAALNLLHDHGGEVDWLLTDIRLPGLIDGWMVADEYRLSHPTRPIIYASAQAQDRRRTVPGSLFVPKPYEVAELVRLARMMATTMADALLDDALREVTQDATEAAPGPASRGAPGEDRVRTIVG